MRFEIRKFDQTTSTNDDVRAAAEHGAAEGNVIWALRQSAGKGRDGRTWQSPEGNLYFSVLLRPTCDVRDYGQYSFIAALAIGDALAEFLPQAKIELKWPNDVLVEGKKISGILLEAGEGFLVAGMGVNIAVTPDNPLYPATSLGQQGMSVAVETVLDVILKKLSFWTDRLAAEGFVPIHAAWLERAKKGPMQVRLPRQETLLNGEFGGLDEGGNLILILADGTRQIIASGDVFF
jgi:BirA family biotin operon repressor/biotin-[acetyl-CoA-carboxylase] ligase